jgi:prepilin-type processing-associated H-X9-DG protein
MGRSLAVHAKVSGHPQAHQTECRNSRTDPCSALSNGAGGVSFADGHSETHKWLDPRTKPPVKYSNALALNARSPNNPDVD